MHTNLLQQYEIASNSLSSSDYKFHRIVSLDVEFNYLRYMRGGSYIELPSWLGNKKACINPKNIDDEECFKWAVIIVLHHIEIGSHPERITKLAPYISLYNLDGIKFPVKCRDIERLERQNPTIAVNVLFEDRGETYQW